MIWSLLRTPLCGMSAPRTGGWRVGRRIASAVWRLAQRRCRVGLESEQLERRLVQRLQFAQRGHRIAGHMLVFQLHCAERAQPRQQVRHVLHWQAPIKRSARAILALSHLRALQQTHWLARMLWLAFFAEQQRCKLTPQVPFHAVRRDAQQRVRSLFGPSSSAGRGNSPWGMSAITVIPSASAHKLICGERVSEGPFRAC